MLQVPQIFLLGASYVKKNSAQFKAECKRVAELSDTCQTAQKQLLAASVASSGKANTGLNETGWRGLAELIGMCSPSSTKLIIPAGVDPQHHKRDVFNYWIRTGYYPSSRKDGQGGSSALTTRESTGEMLVLMGVRAYGRTGKGKDLSASVSLAEQKAAATRNAPETVPAVESGVIILT